MSAMPTNLAATRIHTVGAIAYVERDVEMYLLAAQHQERAAAERPNGHDEPVTAEESLLDLEVKRFAHAFHKAVSRRSFGPLDSMVLAVIVPEQ